MKLQKSTSNFQLAPEGVTQAVLVDVIDMGLMEDKFNPGDMIPKVRLAFQTEETTDAGTPFVVSTFPDKASLNPKSNLYKKIKAIIGRPLEDEDYDEEGNVDLDSLLIGRNANITITHSDGEPTYANVTDIGTLTSKQQKGDLLEPKDYVRVQDRDVEVTDSEGKKIPF